MGLFSWFSLYRKGTGRDKVFPSQLTYTGTQPLSWAVKEKTIQFRNGSALRCSVHQISSISKTFIQDNFILCFVHDSLVYGKIFYKWVPKKAILVHNER